MSVLRQPLRPPGRILPVLLGMILVTAGTAGAETWRWHHVAHVANEPAVNGQSTVDIAANEISFSYTVPLRGRDLVIASCRAALSDVLQASAVRTEGRIIPSSA